MLNPSLDRVISVLIVFVAQGDWVSGWLHMLSRGRVVVASVGETVNLVCDFHSDNFNLFDNPLVWEKTQFANNAIQLNMMGKILEPFASTNRFHMKLTQDRPKYSLLLSITGVQLEDNGNYTCIIHGPENTQLGMTQHALIVTSSVDNILISNCVCPETGNFSDYDYFNYSIDYSTQRALIFTETDTRPLRCIVHGGYPPPDVTVQLGQNDVTNYFRLAQLSRLVGVTGLQVKRYVTERISTLDFQLTADDNGKQLRCVATTKDVATNSSVARIIVHYAPIVKCEWKSVLLYERNVFLRCDVRARPKAKICWVVDSNGTQLTGDDSTKDYYVNLTEHKKGVTETQLIVRHVRPESFQVYELIAWNSVGTTRVPVELTNRLRWTTRRPVVPAPRSNNGRQTSMNRRLDFSLSSASLSNTFQSHSTLFLVLTVLLAFSAIFAVT